MRAGRGMMMRCLSIRTKLQGSAEYIRDFAKPQGREQRSCGFCVQERRRLRGGYSAMWLCVCTVTVIFLGDGAISSSWRPVLEI